MATRLLIIDPDITFMVNVRQALEKTGEFEVSISANGMAAQDALLRRRYDVAVIDFNVPDMDVMELIALLRQVQTDLPVIMCPRTAAHQERVRYLDIQGAIQKPYIARDLIPYVRSVLTRERARREQASDEYVPPEMPEALRHLVSKKQSPTELLDQVEREKLEKAFPQGNDLLTELESIEQSKTRPLPQQTTRLDDGASDPAQTVLFGDETGDPAQTTLFPEDTGESSAATQLLEWQETDQTSRLAETEMLDDLLDQHGWTTARKRQTKPLGPRPGEPPLDPEDTPVVPIQDLPAVRQFLATEQPGQDSVTFGEVLESVSQSPVTEPERSDVDRAFHSLVDSMRTPESHRPTLDDLLNSIAADTAQVEAEAPGTTDEALDFVLNAIRRGVSPSVTDESSTQEFDDRTIGDVFSDLFDPSFEGVLAALAGEEIDEQTYEEPTYSTAAQEGLMGDLGPSEGDQYAYEDMTAQKDMMPEWLSDYEHMEGEPPGSMPEEGQPVIPEPPTSPEDSSSYPATAALNAITSLEKDEFSLSLLLEQIEQQIPAGDPKRPQLKPLPSWQKEKSEEDAHKVEAMFDHFEGNAPPVPPPPDSAFAIPEPDHAREDTRPSLSMLDEIESFPVQDMDTTPNNLNLLDDIWPDEAAGDQVEDDSGQTPLAADWIDESDLVVDEGKLDDAAIAEAFYAGIQQPDDERVVEYETYAEQPDDERVVKYETYAELPDDEWVDEAQVFDDLPGVEPVDDEAYDTLPLDDDHLIPVPVSSLTMLLQEPAEKTIEETEEELLAQIAVQLTQFSLESSAQATLLSRPGQLLAQAGELPDPAMERLFQVVDTAWHTSPPESGALVRYIRLPDIGEFLLYSTYVMEDLILSMAFHSNTSMRTMRRQAQRLSESLAFVPESDEPEAASTLPSRPTDLRPPAGLHEAALELEIAAGDEVVEVVDEIAAPARPDGPYAAYTCLWLLNDPGQEMQDEFAEELASWIGDIAAANAWDIDSLEVRSDYVVVSLSVPHKTLPDAVVSLLMDETTQRCADTYPDVAGDPFLMWADGYYVVTPPRLLTEREIARFITYQRQAQLS